MAKMVPFTPDDLYAACLEVYHDGEHTPYQAWIDTIGDDVVLVRVSFVEEFCSRCVARLEALRILLHQAHGYSMAITFVIYMEDLETLKIRDRAAHLQGLFLALD